MHLENISIKDFMKVSTIRLHKELGHSFIVHVEKDPFTPWHHHPEYEIVLIINGKGRRLIGDHVARFEKDDLIVIGPYLPHQWICDDDNNVESGDTHNEAFVIQFTDDFIGTKFFEIPETTGLKRLFVESSRGIEFKGNTKNAIISIMHEMRGQNDSERFFSLLRIFEILNSTTEFTCLATPNSINNFSSKDNIAMQLALQYIYQNFQKRIPIVNLLQLTHKSYSSFYPAFKKTFMMPFKDYLLNVRIGYACKLLAEGSMNISEIAYDSGFENIANFNRQFKRIKKMTPSQYQKHYK